MENPLLMSPNRLPRHDGVDMFSNSCLMVTACTACAPVLVSMLKPKPVKLTASV